MLNSAEHVILNACKYKYQEIQLFSGSGKPRMLFFLLIKLKFMSKKNIMLSQFEHRCCVISLVVILMKCFIGIYWIVFVHCRCSFERPLREILTDLQKVCTVEHNSRIFFFRIYVPSGFFFLILHKNMLCPH